MGMFKKVLNAVSPVASVVNKSGPVAKMLGMEKKKGSTGTRGGFGNMAASLANDPKFKNALQEGQARVAPVKAAGMKKGGKVKKGYHKMPDGKIMKDSEHKKTAKSKTSSASKRADGICKKGKTRGRMC
jgi:hypothetical protein